MTATTDESQPGERRSHPRLELRMPLELVGPGVGPTMRAETRNVSSGGIYFVAPAGEWRCGQELELTLAVPPGIGYSPYGGHVTGSAEILRIEPVETREGTHRVGIAVRFRHPLRLAFTS